MESTTIFYTQATCTNEHIYNKKKIEIAYSSTTFNTNILNKEDLTNLLSKCGFIPNNWYHLEIQPVRWGMRPQG